jgi:hypothetical protein
VAPPLLAMFFGGLGGRAISFSIAFRIALGATPATRARSNSSSSISFDTSPRRCWLPSAAVYYSWARRAASTNNRYDLLWIAPCRSAQLIGRLIAT